MKVANALACYDRATIMAVKVLWHRP